MLIRHSRGGAGPDLVNSEDGLLYRWDLASNTFSQRIRLGDGLGQAYTPTAIGAVYAISNARVFSVGRWNRGRPMDVAAGDPCVLTNLKTKAGFGGGCVVYEPNGLLVTGLRSCQ